MKELFFLFIVMAILIFTGALVMFGFFGKCQQEGKRGLTGYRGYRPEIMRCEEK